ncbi:hypothetical protein Tco_0838783 [Tanacetum coccineum]|uniref:RNA-directed DNA polymerase, eukaryota n=1 Tax=Tanacetum coccineum TaxID=301880 RepID=A0ABQ5ASP9_9ASTR
MRETCVDLQSQGDYTLFRETSWIKEERLRSSSAKVNIQNRLSVLDKSLDQGRCNDGLVNERSNLLKELHDLNSCASLDMFQNDKIRWAIEGDENSKYFLGNSSPRLTLESQFPNSLSSDQQSDLERDVSYDQIKKAVWDCGINKSPGPDGFTFEFFRSDVQAAFVSNRQILDGPFIINELLSWCKHKNSKAMVFKVDFEKAFDSVRWDYLDDVLNKFGFGVK